METYNPKLHPLITIVTSDSNPLGKKFPKDKDYQPGVLHNGNFEVIYIPYIKELYSNLMKLTKYQVFLLGIPKQDNLYKGRISSRKMIQFMDNVLTRTKEDIGWNPYGISFILIDIDFGDIPNFVLNTAKEVLAFLISLDPELVHCGILILQSSSQKFNPEKKGWHCYIKVSNANDSTVKLYAETLQSICWIKGLGNIKFSKSGSILVRQVFDMAVFSPERIVVESCFSDDETVIFHEIEPLIQEGIARELYE